MIRTANGKYYNGSSEITEEEYNALQIEICEKAEWVNKISDGEADISECPEEWKEEISRRVEARNAEKDLPIEPSADDKAEAYDILMGVSE